MVNGVAKEHGRAIVMIIIGMFAALWIMTNFEFQTGGIYVAMAIVCFLLYGYAKWWVKT